MTTFYDKWAVLFTRRLMNDFDCSELDAFAIVGNGGGESNGFKSLQEIKPLVKGSRGGYGIMQWTGPRRRAYEAYCKRNGLDPADMDANYAFLFVELKGSEGKDGKVLQRVQAARTLETKVEVFMKEFLRPGIPHLDNRIRWAKRAEKAWIDALIADAKMVPEKPKPKPQPPALQPEPEPVQELGFWAKLWKVLVG